MNETPEYSDGTLAVFLSIAAVIQAIAGFVLVFTSIAEFEKGGWAGVGGALGVFTTSLLWFALARIIELLNDIRDQQVGISPRPPESGEEPDVYNL